MRRMPKVQFLQVGKELQILQAGIVHAGLAEIEAFQAGGSLELGQAGAGDAGDAAEIEPLELRQTRQVRPGPRQ